MLLKEYNMGEEYKPSKPKLNEPTKLNQNPAPQKLLVFQELILSIPTLPQVLSKSWLENSFFLEL